MRLSFFLSLIVACMMCVPLHAEYYQYVDQDGNLHFTDNKADVPSSQRETVKTYQTREQKTQAEESPAPNEATESSDNKGRPDTAVKSDQAGNSSGTAEKSDTASADNDSKTETQPDSTDVSGGDNQDTSKDASESSAREVRKLKTGTQLNAAQDKLIKRYSDLQAEKAAILQEAPATDAPAEEKSAYQERITEYNQKLDQYKKDYSDFKQDMDTFNQYAGRPSRPEQKSDSNQQ